MDSSRDNIPPLLLLYEIENGEFVQKAANFCHSHSPLLFPRQSARKSFFERTDKKAEDLESVLSVTSV